MKDRTPQQILDFVKMDEELTFYDLVYAAWMFADENDMDISRKLLDAVLGIFPQ